MKKLLLIKTDNIGDYILFRNFIEVLKKHNKYKNYKITLIGNSVFKNLAESLDSKYIDEFIWLDTFHYAYNFLYRDYINYKLNKKNYDVIINPVLSRTYRVTEAIVSSVNAEEKIGSTGDLTNISAAHKILSDEYYTKLIPISDGVRFEFFRNKEFFEALLQEEIQIQKPFININFLRSKIKLPKNKYVTISPGAFKKIRQWKPENFATITDFIFSEFGFNVVICGSKKDKIHAKKIENLVQTAKPLDLTGKTSLLDLMYVIKNSEFVISSDTCSYHIAAALDKKVICLSNGNTFGRFIPYPSEIYSNAHYLFPPQISENINNKEDLIQKYFYASALDINQIKVEEVKKVIKSLENELYHLMGLG